MKRRKWGFHFFFFWNLGSYKALFGLDGGWEISDRSAWVWKRDFERVMVEEEGRGKGGGMKLAGGKKESERAIVCVLKLSKGWEDLLPLISYLLLLLFILIILYLAESSI